MDIDIMWSQFNKYRPMLDEMYDSVVLLPPRNKHVPYVSGVTDVGGTLNCTMGEWWGMQVEPHSYAYEWSTGGTEANYIVTEADVGQEITCVVTATNPNGSTAAPPSNAVTGGPAVVGTEAAGEAADGQSAPPMPPPNPRHDNDHHQTRHRRT